LETIAIFGSELTYSCLKVGVYRCFSLLLSYYFNFICIAYWF